VEHPFRFAFKNDKENIFAQFLFDENNYLLNYFLIAQIKAKITELNDLTSIEDIEADFAERVAQLKILAKVFPFVCDSI
jgi:primosomal protein N''